MKILGLIDKNQGSKYHRIELVLKEMNKIYSSELTVTLLEGGIVPENVLKNTDILYWNRVLPLEPYKISEYKKKYGIKFVMDLDDIVYINENSIFSKQIDILEKQILASDMVFCTNSFIKKEIEHLNENIHIIPNRVPFYLEQFSPRNKEKNDKINFGFICSASHKQNLLSLKNVFKSILNNEIFQKKARLVFVNPDEEILKCFLHPKVEIIVKKWKSTSDYMDLYDEIDVLLAPLEKTKFNKGRSLLKLFEATSKEVLVIGDYEYSLKENGIFKDCFLPIIKKSDWKWWIFKCLKDFDIKGVAIKNRNHIQENFKYEEVLKNRIDLFKNLAHNNAFNERYQLYSITYGNYIPEFTQYDNSHIKTKKQKSWRFEGNPIIDIINNYDLEKSEFVGIFSHRLGEKTKLFNNYLQYKLKNLDNNKIDFINLCPKYSYSSGKDFLLESEKYHPGINKLLEEVCNYIGLNYTNSPKIFNYSNFFIMKKELYKEYVNNYLIPAYNYMEKNSKFMEDSFYKQGDINLKRLELDHYPMLPFVAERIPIFFVETLKLNHIYLN